MHSTAWEHVHYPHAIAFKDETQSPSAWYVRTFSVYILTRIPPVVRDHRHQYFISSTAHEPRTTMVRKRETLWGEYTIIIEYICHLCAHETRWTRQQRAGNNNIVYFSKMKWETIKKRVQFFIHRRVLLFIICKKAKKNIYAFTAYT